MTVLKRLAVCFLVAVLALGCAVAYAEGEKTPRYVFLFIGDGMGPAHRQLAEYGLKATTGDQDAVLTMDSLPFGGNLMTTPADGAMITDSAAAGSAMATGVKHENGTLAVNSDGKPLKTLAELAKEAGYALGIVSNGKVAGATPASFTAHIADRDLQNQIADQQFELGIDFLGCSGYRTLVPADDPSGESSREDERDLAAEYKAAGYDVFIGEDSVEAFRTYRPGPGARSVAAFTPGSYPYVMDMRAEGLDLPSLAEVTGKGIALLSQDPEGFFFLIENDVLDDCGHYKDSAGVMHEVIDLDNAVKVALAFYIAHPDETLVLVTADHETGGLGVGTAFDYSLQLDKILAHKASVEGNIEYEKGDSDGYYALVKDLYGFEPDEAQKARLDGLMRAIDAMDEVPDIEENPLYQETVDMINASENIGFTTWEHTACPVPLTAVGVGAERFGGMMENTEFARRLASAMGLALENQ